MKIDKTCQNPVFTAKFVNNKAFGEVVDYAHRNGKLNLLDGALSKLRSVNEGDLLLVHKGNSKDELLSNITLNGKKSASVQRSYYDAESKEELSFFGILDLANLENSHLFKTLFGKKVKNSVTPQDIINRYTV